MMYTWQKIDDLKSADLPDNKPYEVLAGNKRIGLLKREQKILAFSATCPHAGANLCEGWLDARGNIVCPLHSYRFDVVNGRNTSGEGYKLFTYPVEIRDNEIFIGILPA